MGVTLDDVDLAEGVVHIRRTIIRVRGVGLVAKVTKSRAGLRSLPIPGWLVAVLAGRQPDGKGSAPVFPDTSGGFRDRNNIERNFRQVRQGTPFGGVVPPTYRKTVATISTAMALSARIVADQLGHARISMRRMFTWAERLLIALRATALEGPTP